MRSLLLLVALACLVSLPASAQELKTIEQHLKADYEGKLVRLNYALETTGFRLELPGGEKKSLGSGGRAYLRVESIKLKKNEIELRARRAGFWLDADGVMHEVVGPTQAYRLRWEDETPTESQLREALAQLAPVRDALDEDWAGYWKKYSRESFPKTFDQKPWVIQEVFNIGGEVTAPLCEYCPIPDYPEEMRAEKVYGVVVLWCVLTEDGQPAGIRVHTSGGKQFDNSAAYALTRWRFKPAMREGRPVAAWMAIEISFRLY